MSNIKFCRFTSNCGPQSKCKGNLFGLIRGKCISTKGECRWDSNCPKYYQCAGNQGGFTEGKCLLAISKSNPLSKSLGNISTSLLNPASQYRKTHTVNWALTIIIFALIGGIGYYVYFAFLQPVKLAPPGVCSNSADCVVKGPGGKNITFQCGIKEFGASPAPEGGPPLIGVDPNKCDCSTLQSGGYSSKFTMYKNSLSQQNPNWLFDTDGNVLASSANCKVYFDNERRIYRTPILNTSPP